MQYPTYAYTGNENIPAIITLGGHSTPVWIQSKWQEGEYAPFIRKNGCGHCCTAMALNLRGISIDPHQEFALCRQRWGDPRMGAPLEEDNFISATGIADILTSFSVPARAFGVPDGGAAADHIVQCLSQGKQVIFWSHPSEKRVPNPFSTGEHYVMAVGLTEAGEILVANSGVKGATPDGIQLTDRDTLAAVLFETCEPGPFTWGRYDLRRSGGYIVVG